jgi:hypothetical protein
MMIIMHIVISSSEIIYDLYSKIEAHLVHQKKFELPAPFVSSRGGGVEGELP